MAWSRLLRDRDSLDVDRIGGKLETLFAGFAWESSVIVSVSLPKTKCGLERIERRLIPSRSEYEYSLIATRGWSLPKGHRH
jgi:hypothetical protein